MRIHLYSLHGLFRGRDLEIGRDADNGGQIIYVMELARALSERPEVTQVHLFTRRMDDPATGPDYARPVETVTDKFDIRRVWCGGKKYLPKEQLWPHLDEFVTHAVHHSKTHGILPDWIHSHYGDAAYVATELSSFLNVPFAHTGHSLGRQKLEKLLDSGMAREEAMRRFAFEQRFAAENSALANAEFIVTSTDLEVRSYGGYPSHSLAEFHVIPPGLNFDRYFPYYDDLVPGADMSIAQRQALYEVGENLEKFLTHPDRPPILAICRPDRKKNIDGLIRAYGTDPELQHLANLIVFAGIRSDISTMPPGEKEVLTDILLQMDRYNLYGRIAIPKKHDTATDVPAMYRLCAQKKGVFVNIALTEPFGLTILEASACGCPVVATNEGGPPEIVRNCDNGLLVDPRDTAAIQASLKRLLIEEDTWRRMSKKGIQRVREHYSWETHVETYMKLVEENRAVSAGQGRKNLAKNPKLHGRLKAAKRMIISDIDGTLISEKGDYAGLEELKGLLRNRSEELAFGIASGRSLDKIQAVLEKFEVPTPDVVISSVGTYIHYGYDARYVDKGWSRHVDHLWDADRVRESLASVEGLELQEPENQNPFKISYYVDEECGPDIAAVREALGRQARNVNVVLTQGAYLDILAKRASKGRAVRYLGNKWSIPLDQVVVCGDAGNDLDMLTGATRGIVVGNHAPELEELRGLKRVYFARRVSAAGILEGLDHFGFRPTAGA
ncbi:MAG: HAD-IIB family hydrolase [Verrucomicrobiales bacterium]|nr:HAD-IIB family hydrolase [Verrucomicrobiales bacterium]